MKKYWKQIKKQISKFVSYLKSLRLCCKKCGYCENFHVFLRHRRLNTRYVNEEQNWITCCDEQFNELVDYYKERWDEYYSSRF